jgi:hypothetical protein
VCIVNLVSEMGKISLLGTIPPATANFTTESEQHMNEDTRRLLRADSIFGITGSKPKHFYPGVIFELKRNLTAELESRPKRRADHDYGAEITSLEGLDTSSLYVAHEFQDIAEELLKRLGKPGGVHLEVEAIGQRFVCARCWNKHPMTWVEIVGWHIQPKRAI